MAGLSMGFTGFLYTKIFMLATYTVYSVLYRSELSVRTYYTLKKYIFSWINVLLTIKSVIGGS